MDEYIKKLREAFIFMSVKTGIRFQEEKEIEEEFNDALSVIEQEITDLKTKLKQRPTREEMLAHLEYRGEYGGKIPAVINELFDKLENK